MPSLMALSTLVKFLLHFPKSFRPVMRWMLSKRAAVTVYWPLAVMVFSFNCDWVGVVINLMELRTLVKHFLSVFEIFYFETIKLCFTVWA
jgi:hypothetical protein